MHGAEVNETVFTPDGWRHEQLRLIVRRVAVSAADLVAGHARARRRSTIPAEQLQMVLDGHLDPTYAYSFIVTDIPAQEKDTVQVEHYHRHRAQIEERFKDAKLGQPLQHLPSGELAANRLWLTCRLLALNVTALVCDISPAAAASGTAPERTPLRRHAKALRQILFCVPARSVRQTTLHLPAEFRDLHIFQATYTAANTLGTP
jgi:hypothetical protein